MIFVFYCQWCGGAVRSDPPTAVERTCQCENPVEMIPPTKVYR